MSSKPPDHVAQNYEGQKGPRARSIARPVSALALSNKAGFVIKEHQHSRHQLIYAISGVMTIQAHKSIWTVPPSHALWMPAGVDHQIRMVTAVEIRTLYFQTSAISMPTNKCLVFAVTPLLRELIVRAMQMPPHYRSGTANERIMQLICDEVTQLQVRHFTLPLPTDRRLQLLSEQILRDLSDNRTIGQLGQIIGLSERSVMRLFLSETGFTVAGWRQQARLMQAFVLMEQGLSTTRISSDLGYASASAFSKMFQKVFGETPRAKIKRADL
jgi:AraC-like DNA-binding protein/mannose-6-phosphate isomerase-like protein (cupin superfamily)